MKVEASSTTLTNSRKLFSITMVTSISPITWLFRGERFFLKARSPEWTSPISCLSLTELRSVQLSLHFLATGNENAFEGNLVFEKFLCGVPLKMSVQKQSLLTDLIKNEANELLNEVVRHWAALKNTSADGLRQMFIQRDGKLFQENDKYKLIVERKAQDFLLERLSWNIAVIKLPWISNILFTEW